MLCNSEMFKERIARDLSQHKSLRKLPWENKAKQQQKKTLKVNSLEVNQMAY